MNQTSSTNDNSDCLAPVFFNIIITGIGSCIILENILMIFAIWRTASLHTIPNIFIMSLGIIDILVGFVAGSIGVFALGWNTKWPAMFLYPMTGGGSVGLIIGSFLHMSSIAIDKYTYIAHPFFYQRNVDRKFIYKVLAVIWVGISVLCAIPMTMQSSASQYSACIIRTLPTVYKVHVASTMTYLSLVVTCVAYLKIAALSYKQRRAIAAVTWVTKSLKSADGQADEGRAGVMKSIKFFMVVFGFFFVTSTPAMICISMEPYYYIPEPVFAVFLILGPMNSMTNFFVYFIMNKEFRNAVKKIFTDICQSRA